MVGDCCAMIVLQVMARSVYTPGQDKAFIFIGGKFPSRIESRRLANAMVTSFLSYLNCYHILSLIIL